MPPRCLRPTLFTVVVLLLPVSALTPATHAMATPQTSTDGMPPLAQRGTNLDNFSTNPAYAPWFGQKVEWSEKLCPRPEPEDTPQRQMPEYQWPIRFECSTVKVPLNWHHPDQGTIAVGISRAHFRETPAQPARLMLTAGEGPGEARIFDDPAESANLAQSFHSHLHIAVEPRGMGLGTPAECDVEPGTAPPTDTVKDSRALTPEFLRAGLTYQNSLIHPCLTKPGNLAPHLNSEQIARDYDLIRHVLGYTTADVNASGYGTVAASLLGKMFPRTYDRITLTDSPNLTASTPAGLHAHAAEASQAVIDRAILPWMARHDQHFHLGTTTAQVNANYETVRAALARRAFKPTWHPNILDTFMRTALTGNPWMEETAFVVSALYANLTQGTAIPAVIEEKLEGWSRRQEMEYHLWEINSFVEAAVTCNDTGSAGTINDVAAAMLTSATTHTVMRFESTQLNCAEWPLPAALTPALLNRPLYALMAHHEANPRRHYREAYQTRTTSSGLVRMVAVDDVEGSAFHTNPCLSKAVGAYLHDGAFPATDVRCQAGPMPGDSKVYEFMNPSSTSQPLPLPYAYTTRDLTEPKVDEEASATATPTPSAIPAPSASARLPRWGHFPQR